MQYHHSAVCYVFPGEKLSQYDESVLTAHIAETSVKHGTAVFWLDTQTHILQGSLWEM